MANRAPSYGPGVKLLLTFRRLKRRLSVKRRRGKGGMIVRFVKRFIGLVLMMSGGAVLALAISIFLGSVSTFFFLTGGIAFGAGLWFFGGKRRKRVSGRTHKALPVTAPAPDSTPRSTRLIRLAKRLNGELTINQTALEFGIEYPDAKEALDELHRIGSCHQVVGDKGVLLYRFPEFIPETPAVEEEAQE